MMKKMTRFVFLFLVCCAAAEYAKPPENYALVWSDEFDQGAAPDSNTWKFDNRGPMRGDNVEHEYYTPANITIQNGVAVIEARKEKTKQGDVTWPYTSGWMSTEGKKSFKYGYIEVRIKAPFGKGVWSAFWTLGENLNTAYWPACGEMDFFYNNYGSPFTGDSKSDSVFSSACNFQSAGGGVVYNKKQYAYSEELYKDYHLYAILWDSAFVEYYFDDKVFWSRTETPGIIQSNNIDAFHQPHCFIANVAVAGDPDSMKSPNRLDTAVFPQRMYIDYVRVYEKSTGIADAAGASRAKSSMVLLNPASAWLKVFDMRGRLVADYTPKVRIMKPGQNAVRMLRPDLPAGAYIVRLSDGAFDVSQKLIIGNTGKQ
jgi:beta-glucanase (GH16 family)